MKLSLNSHPRVRGREEFRRASHLMQSMASSIPPRDTLVEVNLVGERRMASLNKTYRGTKGAPEILTFPYGGDRVSDPDGEGPEGEIYVCWRSLTIGARRRRVSRSAYLLRLLVHGLCHLRGYHHDDLRSERQMEEAEKKLLRLYLPENVVARLFV